MRLLAIGVVAGSLALAACGGSDFDADQVTTWVDWQECSNCLEIGTGEGAFQALRAGDGLEVTWGPQGGYHVVVSFRVRGIDPGSSEIRELMPAIEYRLLVGGQPIHMGEPRRYPVQPSVRDHEYQVVGHHLMVYDEVVLPLEDFAGTPIRLEVTVTDKDGNVRSSALDLVAVAKPAA